MNSNEIRYEEDFIKDHVLNDPNSIQYALAQIKDVHSSNSGWVMSEPYITPNPDGKTVTIKVHLTQYYVDNQDRGYSR